MDPRTAVYDKGGHLVCRSCEAQVIIAEGNSRANTSAVMSALAIPVFGVLSWTCVNQLFIMTIASVAGGVGWLLMVARHADLRRRMGGTFAICLAAVILGMLLGVAPVGLFALSVLLRAAR
jgi:hypothetical protein